MINKIKGVIINDEYLNFSNFVKGMLVLIKCSYNDDWSYIMMDLSKTRDSNLCTDNCGSKYAYPFFILF